MDPAAIANWLTLCAAATASIFEKTLIKANLIWYSLFTKIWFFIVYNKIVAYNPGFRYFHCCTITIFLQHKIYTSFSYQIIYFPENQEKFYLYLIISVTAGVLLCLILVIGRLWIQKRRLKKDPSNIQSSNTGETTLPNGFSDDISEIDADIDLTTPLPLPSVSRSDVSILLVKTKFLYYFSSVILVTIFLTFSYVSLPTDMEFIVFTYKIFIKNNKRL